MSAPLLTSTLERNITKLARDVAARITNRDRADAEADIAQELRKFVLELHQTGNYRGEHGADFATYAYRALRFAAWRVGGQLQCPVHTARNRGKDAWGAKSMTPKVTSVDHEKLNDPQASNDAMDLLVGDGEPEEGVLAREITQSVRAVLNRQQHPEVLMRVLLRGEPMEAVAREMNLHFGSVRKAVERGRIALAEDPKLRALAL